MRQVWITKAGPPDVLQVREAPDPSPGPGEVRIRVEAAGVNYADVVARMGMYQDAPRIPFVVGYEVAGTVDAVGEGVPAARVGEPVVALTRFGGYSEAVVVSAFQATRRPAGMDAVTGAAIPVVGLTAWMMIEVMGRPEAGDRVLIHSAGGGVGLAAVQLAKARGAWVAGTASAGKHERLPAWGYDQLIDYTREDYEQVLAAGPGLDLVLDPLGGAHWARALRLLRGGGRLICYGVSSATPAGQSRGTWSMLRMLAGVPWLKVNPVTLMNETHGVMGVNMGRLWHEGERLSGYLERLLERWEAGTWCMHVHATVPFDRAAEAHRLLEERRNFGKVVLVP